MPNFDPTLFDPFSPQFWIFVGVAMACGAMFGFERRARRKSVGIRTAMLVSLSTAIFVRLGASSSAVAADPARVLGQVVTGVGFLGAGVIMARGGVLVGVTTAAVIWTLAAVGSMVGLGYYWAALALSLILAVLLPLIDRLEHVFSRRKRKKKPEVA